MGILKTAGRVAIASSVHGRVQRRQQQRWAAQDAQHAAAQHSVPPQAAQQHAAATAPPTAPSNDDFQAQIDQLKQLADLRDAGILTEDEFTSKKAQILGL